MQPNWAKIIGELIADHELSTRKQLEPLAARVAALEARPLDKGDAGELPAELVEQINSTKQMLQEPLPVPEIARQAEPPRHITGSMITRDGMLAVSYSDGTIERLGPVIGPSGEAGPQGAPGRDGAKGDEGPPGRDGVGIAAYAINRKGELMITGTDGTVHTPGRIGNDEKQAAA